MMKTANVFYNTTINDKEYIISSCVRPCGKIGYYVNQLGELTQWAKAFNTGERLAHRVNPQMRVKGMHRISKPYNSGTEAVNAAIEHSRLSIRYF